MELFSLEGGGIVCSALLLLDYCTLRAPRLAVVLCMVVMSGDRVKKLCVVTSSAPTFPRPGLPL